MQVQRLNLKKEIGENGRNKVKLSKLSTLTQPSFVIREKKIFGIRHWNG